MTECVCVYLSLCLKIKCIMNLFSKNISHVNCIFLKNSSNNNLNIFGDTNKLIWRVVTFPLRKETRLTLEDNVFIENSSHLLFKYSVEPFICLFIWQNIRLIIAGTSSFTSAWMIAGRYYGCSWNEVSEILSSGDIQGEFKLQKNQEPKHCQLSKIHTAHLTVH